MSNDETMLLERAFGTTFAHALTWCTENPGYTPTPQSSDADEDDQVDDDADDETRGE